MKKITLSLIALCLATTVFAEEISELYREFLRRDAVVFTKNQVRVLTFLQTLNFEIKDIEKLEFIDSSHPTQFIIQVKGGDICLGDIDSSILRCKNAMGITSVEFNGDAD